LRARGERWEAEVIDREMMRILTADLASRYLKVRSARFESVELFGSWEVGVKCLGQTLPRGKDGNFTCRQIAYRDQAA
jgi:hypothetical protein